MHCCQRTRVQFPVLTYSSSELPTIPDLGEWAPCFASAGTHTHKETKTKSYFKGNRGKVWNLKVISRKQKNNLVHNFS